MDLIIHKLIVTSKRQLNYPLKKFPQFFRQKSTWILILSVLFSGDVLAKRKHKESYYQKAWCENRGGKVEVVLSDRTRVDCVTKSHAIEFDFAKKWAEAIGQALGYSIETGKIPGIILIVTKRKHYKYWIKLNSVIHHYKLPIVTFIIEDY